jgi:mitochondrial fission protein ELM1
MNHSGSFRRSSLPQQDARGGAEASILRLRPVTATPRIWLLVGDKLGDNQQVELIANRLTERLNWQVDVKQLRFKDAYRVGKPEFRSDHSHVDWNESDAVAQPWPDLVITVGRRPSMVALWIKEQSRGLTKIVIVGRPRRWLSRFNLIIAAAHHHLPDLPNVMRLGLPLIKADSIGLESARGRWSASIAEMPRPLFALFVGGPTKPHVFDSSVALDLMAKASRCAAEAGGSLWVTTSPRTSVEVVDTLEQSLPENGRLFRWRAKSPDNPYLALLACADRFIVTGDSVSMQVEVARLGKPLAIYPLPVHYGFVERLRRATARFAYGRKTVPFLSRLIRAMQRFGVVKFPRDVAEIHSLLFEQGFAVPLGEPFGGVGGGVDVDLDHIVDRIRELFVRTDGATVQRSAFTQLLNASDE